MAHYAFIDENNIVVQVITGIDETETQIDSDGTVVGGSTEAWETFYENLPMYKNLNLKCKRTSINGNIRSRYAHITFIYDAVQDIFVAPEGYPEAPWSLFKN